MFNFFIREVKRRGRMLSATFAIGLIAGLLVFYGLGTMLPGQNSYETSAVARIKPFAMPWSKPIDAPYYALAKLLNYVFSPLMSLRIASALIGLALIFTISYVLRNWFNNRVAVAGTLFIVTSSWFLSMARIGYPAILPALWVALLLAIGSWRTYTTKPLITDITLAVVAALSLYSHYFLWFLFVGILVMATRRKKQLFVLPRKHQWILPVIVVPILAPLVIGLIRDRSQISELLGTSYLSIMAPDYFKQVFQNISQLFFRGQAAPYFTLGRLPFLDIFSVVMVAIGARYIEQNLKLRRNRLVVGLTTVIIAIISLQEFNVLRLSILFPLVMLVAVCGIVELLERWLKSFPHNPIARSIGVCVLVTAIGFSSYYHLERYFVAWANNPDVLAAHNIKADSSTVR